MKRIVLLTALAAMMAAAMALSGVAQAAPVGGKADAKCLVEAVRTLQPGFKPSDYNFVGGTAEGESFNLQATAGPDVFCGFGGDDVISTLDEGDIFLGGEGADGVVDEADGVNYGTFYGGAGNDDVDYNLGTFNGGAGDDHVYDNYGTFYGDAGDDRVFLNEPDATFNGGEGNDRVSFNAIESTFIGGPGFDTVVIGANPVDGP